MKVIANSKANQTPHLTPGQVYIVVGLDQEAYRVLNDNEEPILYEKSMFELDEDDSNLPSSWIREDFGDGEYFINPPELSARGFYEDFFDGIPSANAMFKDYLSKNGIRLTGGG